MTKLQKLTLVITLIISIINILLITSIKINTANIMTALSDADIVWEEY